MGDLTPRERMREFVHEQGVRRTLHYVALALCDLEVEAEKKGRVATVTKLGVIQRVLVTFGNEVIETADEE